jgi:hypothetical protein
MTVKEMIQQLVSLPMDAQVVSRYNARKSWGRKVTGVLPSGEEVSYWVLGCVLSVPLGEFENAKEVKLMHPFKGSHLTVRDFLCDLVKCPMEAEVTMSMTTIRTGTEYVSDFTPTVIRDKEGGYMVEFNP